MNEAFRANKNFLYLFIDDNVITPGPFLYHHEYFRDASYSLLALENLGFHNEVERILLNYPQRQRTDGYYVSQTGEWDSNGEALWSFYIHYLFTRRKDFIEQIFNSAYAGYRWIKQACSKTGGLLPAGFSAEHFGPPDQYYWDNFWALAGLKGFCFLAQELNKEKEATEVADFIDDYTKAIFASVTDAAKKYPFPVIPPSAKRGLDSSLIGSICVLYPLRLLTSHDPRLTGTLRVLREKYQSNWAFFHRIIHSGYNVYLTAQLAECYLFRRSTRVLPILDWILENFSGTYTFPEAIHPQTGGGCMGDGHHAWACAEIINLWRNLLFFEEDDHLVIMAVAHQSWFEAGESLSCKNAPSFFGRINLKITSEATRTILYLDCNFHHPPAYLEFCLPFKIKRAWIDNHEASDLSQKTIRFSPQTKEVIVAR